MEGNPVMSEELEMMSATEFFGCSEGESAASVGRQRIDSTAFERIKRRMLIKLEKLSRQHHLSKDEMTR